MSTHRIVVRRGSEVLSQGTAWTIDAGIVCTAFHIVGHGAERQWTHELVDGVICQLEGAAQPQRLTALAFDAEADLALLSCDGDVGEPLPLAQLSQRNIAWNARGFPGFHADEEITLSGNVVDLRADAGASSLQLHIAQGSNLDWGGASGAAVMHGPRVIAVITLVTDGVATAWAAPVEAIHRLLALAGQVKQAGQLLGSRAQAGAQKAELIGVDQARLHDWLQQRKPPAGYAALLAAVEGNALPRTQRVLPAALRVRFDDDYGVVPLHDGARALRPIAAREFGAFLNRGNSFGGRRAQLAQIDRWLIEQASGYFFVTGSSGMGKTSLLAHWIDEHRQRGHTVCFHFFTPRVQQALDARHALQRLTEQLLAAHQLGGNPPNNDQARLRALYADLLQLPAPGARPLIVVLDGLDEALDTLQPSPDLFPQPLGAGVHVLFSARKTAGKAWLRDLALPLGSDCQLELGQLSRAEIAELLVRDKLSAADTETFSTALHDKTQGDPFYVDDALQTWRHNGRTLDAIHALPPTHSAYLEDWWHRAIRQNTLPGFVDLMGTLATLREPLTAREIVAVSKDNRFDSAHIGLLIKTAARYIDDDEGGRYGLRHDRIREFVRVTLGDAARVHDERVADFAMRWNDPTASAETRAYGQRQVIPHLQRVGAVGRLQDLLRSDAWTSLRMRSDPSGKTLHDDLTQLRDQIELENRRLLEQRAVPEIWRDIEVAIDLASIKTSSARVSAPLLRALVVCGHWSAETALASLDLIDDDDDVAQLLCNLGPVLQDEALVERAQHKLGRLRLRWTSKAQAALLRRRCELSSAMIEPTFHEINGLDDSARAALLPEISDLLPLPLWQQAADWLLRGRHYAELARLLALAPASRRARGLKLARRGLPYSIVPFQQVLGQLAAAGQGRRARWFIDGADLGHEQTAELFAWVSLHLPAGDPKRRALAEQALDRSRQGSTRRRVDHAVLERALPALGADRQATLLREHLYDAAGKPVVSIADYLAPLVPAMAVELLRGAESFLAGLPQPDKEELAAPVAIRLAELGFTEEALSAARRSGDSYDVGGTLVALLPHLARHGYPETAVALAVDIASPGRPNHIPVALAGVAPHVQGPLFERLLDRARHEQDPDLRREALQRLAPRRAELGRPEDALRMAHLIADDLAIEKLLAQAALCWSSEFDDVQRALDETLRLPAGPARLGAITALGPTLSTPQLERALELVLSAEDSWQRDEALGSLLPRQAALGQHPSAWQVAMQVTDPEAGTADHGLLAAVAAAAPATRRGALLQEAIERLEPLCVSLPYVAFRHLAQLIDVDDERTTRRLIALFEQHAARLVESSDAQRDFVQRATLRLIQLDGSLPALAWARRHQQFGLAETIEHVAHALDLAGVSVAMSLAGLSARHTELTLASLLGRLAELGQHDEALNRLAELNDEVRLKGIALIAPHLTPMQLQRVESLLPGAPNRRHELSLGDEHSRALAAIAYRHASQGRVEEAVRVIHTCEAGNRAAGAAMAAIAPFLPTEMLNAIAARIPGDDNQAKAKAELIARRTNEGANGYLQALAEASNGGALGSSRTALRAVATQAPLTLEPSVLYEGWVPALHALASKTREELLGDLGALLPLAVRIGGPSVLDHIKDSLQSTRSRWP